MSIFSFRLAEDFVEGYRAKKAPFGYQDAAGNSVGEITFLRTYSRLKEDGTKETWVDVCERVINGMYSLQKDHAKSQRLPWSDAKAAASAKEAFDRLYNLKWTPPGRGLWVMGTPLVNVERNSAALQNCAFVVVNNPIRPFTWTFEMLMLGSGVGYNIQKHNVYQLPKLKGKLKIERKDTKDADYIVPDTREGWVKLLGKVLKAHFYGGEGFTYSTVCVRGKGAPIKGFGGTASGPEELCWGINEIHKILNNRSNKKLRPIDCLDIMNIILIQ